MKKVLFIILITLFCLKGFSQESITIYLNDSYSVTQKDSAKYTREVIIDKDHFYITDKHINGVTCNYYELSSINPRIEDGLSVHYDDNNKIYSKGIYEQGKIKGKWLYYNDNRVDTVYYSTSEVTNNRSNYPESIYYTNSEKTKGLGYLIIDSLSCFFKKNFHLPARALDNYKRLEMPIKCIIGPNGKVLWYKIVFPHIHKDISSEISRIMGLFHYEVTVKKPLEILIGFNYGLQTETEIETDDNPVFDIVEEMPEFHYKNSENGFGKYIKDNLKNTISNCNGWILVNLVVEKDGKISNIKIIRGPDNCIGYVDEIERISKACPAWIPGKKKGKPVRVRYTLPISFGDN